METLVICGATITLVCDSSGVGTGVLRRSVDPDPVLAARFWAVQRELVSLSTQTPASVDTRFDDIPDVLLDLVSNLREVDEIPRRHQ